MNFFPWKKRLDAPEADIGHLNDPVPFDDDIQVITEATATGQMIDSYRVSTAYLHLC